MKPQLRIQNLNAVSYKLFLPVGSPNRIPQHFPELLAVIPLYTFVLLELHNPELLIQIHQDISQNTVSTAAEITEVFVVKGHL